MLFCYAGSQRDRRSLVCPSSVAFRQEATNRSQCFTAGFTARARPIPSITHEGYSPCSRCVISTGRAVGYGSLMLTKSQMDFTFRPTDANSFSSGSDAFLSAAKRACLSRSRASRTATKSGSASSMALTSTAVRSALRSAAPPLNESGTGLQPLRENLILDVPHPPSAGSSFSCREVPREVQRTLYARGCSNRCA